MAVTVLAINVRVVIDKVFVACVVRWVDIYNVDFPGVGVSERGKCFEIIALNDYMIWVVNLLIITPPRLWLYLCLL